MREAYVFLRNIEEEYLQKILKEIIETFQKEEEGQETLDVDNLMKGNLLTEMKNILCYLYAEYLSTPEEKQVIHDYFNLQQTRNTSNQKTVLQSNMVSPIKTSIQPQENEEKTSSNTLPVSSTEKMNFFASLWKKIKSIVHPGGGKKHG